MLNMNPSPYRNWNRQMVSRLGRPSRDADNYIGPANRMTSEFQQNQQPKEWFKGILQTRLNGMGASDPEADKILAFAKEVLPIATIVHGYAKRSYVLDAKSANVLRSIWSKLRQQSKMTTPEGSPVNDIPGADIDVLIFQHGGKQSFILKLAEFSKNVLDNAVMLLSGAKAAVQGIPAIGLTDEHRRWYNRIKPEYDALSNFMQSKEVTSAGVNGLGAVAVVGPLMKWFFSATARKKFWPWLGKFVMGTLALTGVGYAADVAIAYFNRGPQVALTGAMESINKSPNMTAEDKRQATLAITAQAAKGFEQYFRESASGGFGKTIGTIVIVGAIGWLLLKSGFLGAFGTGLGTRLSGAKVGFGGPPRKPGRPKKASQMQLPFHE